MTTSDPASISIFKCLLLVVLLTLSTQGKSEADEIVKYFVLFIRGKQVWTFHANAWNVKIYFLGKRRKYHQFDIRVRLFKASLA